MNSSSSSKPQKFNLQTTLNKLQTQFSSFFFQNFNTHKTNFLNPNPTNFTFELTNTTNQTNPFLLSFAKNPLWARINNDNKAVTFGGGMKDEDIEQRLAGVPVYALSNSSEEFVVVSGQDPVKSLGLLCFKEEDAQTLLGQMKSMDPRMRPGSKVVPVALKQNGGGTGFSERRSQYEVAVNPDTVQYFTFKSGAGRREEFYVLFLMVFQLKVNGVSFRFIPESSQIKNAIEERRKAGISDDSFSGVPVFQSRSLVLRSQNRRYRPAFFRKEDLEKSLAKASIQQKHLNPALRVGDLEVAVLEDIIHGMKDDSTTVWDDVVFIPPGFDVSTDASRQ